MKGRVYLFGVRSPLVVDYEETLLRCGISNPIGVALDGTSRMIARDRIVSLEDLKASGQSGTFYPCAFNPYRRAELAAQAIEVGLQPADALIDPTAAVASSVRVGEMSFVNAGAVIGGATFLGQRVLINRSSSIGHHCFIADDVSIAPGVTLAGNIKVGASVIIGVGAVILPDVRIGDRAIIAGGSVVRRDVSEATFVAGNPAKDKPYDVAASIFGQGDQE